MNDIFTGVLFVFASTLTGIILLAVGFMWWETMKDRRGRK